MYIFEVAAKLLYFPLISKFVDISKLPKRFYFINIPKLLIFGIFDWILIRIP